MPSYPLENVVGWSPDGNVEIFDFQISGKSHDIVLARLNGSHDGGVNRRSTFTYAVRDGQLTISIDGLDVDAQAGDVVVVEPGSRKTLNGKAELFIVCSPPYDPEDEE